MVQKKYNKFYFTFNPLSFNNIVQILRSGKIQKWKELIDHSECDTQILDEITGYVYFRDLLQNKNQYDTISKYQFVINPSILKKHGIEFRTLRGLGRGITITSSDTGQLLLDEIELIHDMLNESPKYKNSEIIFQKDIPIRKYVTTIICNQCTDVEFKIICELIAQKKYNIKLIRRIRKNKISKNEVMELFDTIVKNHIPL